MARFNHLSSKNLLLYFLIVLSGTGCSVVKIDYQYSYRTTISLKSDALNLISKSGTNFEDNKEEADRLLLEIDKIYDYNRFSKKGQESAKMWALMRDPEANLLGGFIEFWRVNENTNTFFRKEVAKQVEDAFDTIIVVQTMKGRKRKKVFAKNKVN